jgi:hypothetical protein
MASPTFTEDVYQSVSPTPSQDEIQDIEMHLETGASPLPHDEESVTPRPTLHTLPPTNSNFSFRMNAEPDPSKRKRVWGGSDDDSEQEAAVKVRAS